MDIFDCEKQNFYTKSLASTSANSYFARSDLNNVRHIGASNLAKRAYLHQLIYLQSR